MAPQTNVLFFLTPKEELAYINEDSSLGQTLDIMEQHRYTAIPLLKRSGEYIGTITEGDLLWTIRNEYQMDVKEAMNRPILSVSRHSDNVAVTISTDIEDIIAKSLDQNFVPVEDDRGMFIGIVTRRNIIQYFKNKLEQTRTDLFGGRGDTTDARH